jgi:hypothetical protein
MRRTDAGKPCLSAAEPCGNMSAMLILDKALAIDLLLAHATRVEVPAQFVRQPFRVAAFERVDVPIGAPALVLAPPEPPQCAPLPETEGEPAAAAERLPARTRTLASHLPRTLAWPAFSFALAPQPEG